MQLLEGKNAIVYGAGGAIGSEVARTFAREGATVYMVGRTKKKLDRVAKKIIAEGGNAEVEAFDVFNEQAVKDHVEAVVKEAGTLDVSMNLIRVIGLQGTPLVDMELDDIMAPVVDGLRANLITTRAAAKQMAEQNSGTIVVLDSGSGKGSPMMGGVGPADAALDVTVRNLAAELGPEGVRVVGIWTAGLPETFSKKRLAEHTGGKQLTDKQYKEVLNSLDEMRTTKRSPRLVEVASTAAFLASDRAGAITGSFINATSGMGGTFDETGA